MRMRMHSKSGIVNGLFPDRNRLVVIKVYAGCPTGYMNVLGDKDH